ncbi:TRAFs-binding domain-containing protein [Aurantiacibacter sp. MUD11]|uniref:TRAFs-binding domain-containing protein n=1 Tax=Aurantiacibacter sp. MUD11 TaxID=3003265 RepID=UPI0022AA28B5|nr:TRAFs-binding domain-containing protein [Aurantiacibacter sp. MUD11]WAT18690.1 TRAFs-binding domain-containing protein [Aurantiacibacter sp. MUD11]
MRSHQLRAQIIRHARSGSLDRATALLTEYGEGRSPDDADLCLMLGRILKERGKRAEGSAAADLFLRASERYEQAAGSDQFSYPLINAATLARLAGKDRRAEALAARVLDVLDENPDEAETPYWRHATRAEALLLLGQDVEARAALASAMALAPQAWEDHAVTIGQFTLICEERGLPTAWLDKHRPPRSLQFSGIMDIDPKDEALHRRICETIASENIGFGFGALAAGADILIAECLIERGAMLHVVLPCPRDVFRERSVMAVDPAWGERFDRALEAAASVDELESSSAPDAPSVVLADDVARGMALQNANLLQTSACSLRIVAIDEEPPQQDGSELKAIVLKAARAGGSSYHVPPAGKLVTLGASKSSGGEVIVQEFDTPAAAMVGITGWIAAGHRVVLDYRYRPEGADPAEAHSRLGPMLSVGEAGQVLASKAFAFAMLAQRPEATIESYGEVRSAEGPFDVFLLA